MDGEIEVEERMHASSNVASRAVGKTKHTTQCRVDMISIPYTPQQQTGPNCPESAAQNPRGFESSVRPLHPKTADAYVVVAYFKF